jgi:hypothetical protein
MRYMLAAALLSVATPCGAQVADVFSVKNAVVARLSDGCREARVVLTGDKNMPRDVRAATVSYARKRLRMLDKFSSLVIILKRDDEESRPLSQSLLAELGTSETSSSCKGSAEKLDYFTVASGFLSEKELNIADVHLALSKADFDADKITQNLFKLKKDWQLPRVYGGAGRLEDDPKASDAAVASGDSLASRISDAAKGR